MNGPAPDFAALTTQGVWSLSDYRGKWLVLFSHPADFTPVCTTEFTAFAARSADFAALTTELLGLSIDSHCARIAWVRSIRQSFGVEITFPIIADLDMKVAQAYGMVMPGASDAQAVRATFVIDPDGTLRAMIFYPMTNGRPVDGIHRLVVALQTSAEHKLATPENWHPGQPVIVPTPQTTDAADARMTGGLNPVDWYFTARML